MKPDPKYLHPIKEIRKGITDAQNLQNCRKSLLINLEDPIKELTTKKPGLYSFVIQADKMYKFFL